MAIKVIYWPCLLLCVAATNNTTRDLPLYKRNIFLSGATTGRRTEAGEIYGKIISVTGVREESSPSYCAENEWKNDFRITMPDARMLYHTLRLGDNLSFISPAVKHEVICFCHALDLPLILHHTIVG